jgi:hypothetical protein
LGFGESDDLGMATIANPKPRMEESSTLIVKLGAILWLKMVALSNLPCEPWLNKIGFEQFFKDYKFFSLFKNRNVGRSGP